jgi:malate synthase
MIGILMPKRLNSACRSKPAQPRQSDVQDEAAWDGGERMFQQLGCRRECLDAQPDRTKQAAQPAEHERIIVDDEYDRLFRS